METTVIRRATRDDFDAIARLNREVQEKHARAYPGLFKPASDDTLTRKAFEALLDDRNSTTLVAVDGAEPVGYISAEAFERTETPHRFAHRVLYIHQMCVSRSAKRRGHGRALMMAMQSVASDLGISHIELDTWALNDEARRFFEAQGFHEINIRMARDE